jgi:translocation and assembly module TamA
MDARLGYAIIPGNVDDRAFVGEGEAAVERQDLLVPRLKLGLAASLEKDIFEAYSALGPSARVALDRPFGDSDRLRFGFGWQIRYLDIEGDDRRIETALGISGPYRLAFFEQSVSFDGRDDRFVPRRGTFLHLRIEEGGAFAGSAFEYVRVTPDARLYLPLGRIVFASRVRMGWIRASGDGPSPLTQRYFAGGSSSHRGFGFRRLAPTALNEAGEETPVGGDAMFESSVELRFPLPWSSFRGVAFLDGADATETVADIDLTRLHWAAGFGVRIDTIVGPGRLDVAFRLNRTGDVESDGRENPPGGGFAIHLSLGEAF